MHLKTAIEKFGGAYRAYAGGTYREIAAEEPDGGFSLTYAKGAERLGSHHFESAEEMYTAAGDGDWTVPERLLLQPRFGL